MAKKQAKMGHRGAGGKVQAGEKVNHRVTGGVLRGYTVVNEAGEDVGFRYLMWDAINLRKELDSSG